MPPLPEGRAPSWQAIWAVFVEVQGTRHRTQIMVHIPLSTLIQTEKAIEAGASISPSSPRGEPHQLRRARCTPPMIRPLRAFHGKELVMWLTLHYLVTVLQHRHILALTLALALALARASTRPFLTRRDSRRPISETSLIPNPGSTPMGVRGIHCQSAHAIQLRFSTCPPSSVTPSTRAVR